MSKISQKWGEINKQKAGLIAIIAVILIAAPMFAFSSHSHQLYVNASASGTQDGSKSHPYKTISQAIDAAHGGTDIHVANGTYRENITLKSDMSIFGEDKDGTIIEADDSGSSVVVMNDDSVIDKVTVRKGASGIKVKAKASAKIIKCIVKDNSRDGIKIESDGTGDSRKVDISENTIKNNHWSGISAGKRNLSIMDNDIKFNDKDGLDISAGSQAWVSGNFIYGNSGSGMKLTIDGSDIWTKGNKMNENHREGIEVAFKGAAGKINIAKSQVIGNNRYGLARVQNFPLNANSANLWNRYLTQDANNNFSKNSSGDISAIIVRN